VLAKLTPPRCEGRDSPPCPGAPPYHPTLTQSQSKKYQLDIFVLFALRISLPPNLNPEASSRSAAFAVNRQRLQLLPLGLRRTRLAAVVPFSCRSSPLPKALRRDPSRDSGPRACQHISRNGTDKIERVFVLLSRELSVFSESLTWLEFTCVAMSLLAPDVHSELAQLLVALQSKDNNIRSQAEEHLQNSWTNTRPEVLLMGLAEQIGAARDMSVSIGGTLLLLRSILIQIDDRRVRSRL